jgi:hypothetical protein
LANGSDTQLTDPILDAALGTANVPAYRGLSYQVLDGFVSTLFGDQLPTPHDTVLIGLAQVGKLLQGFLATSEIARMEDRLRKVGGVDLIVQEVAAALREAQIATANFALRSSL